MTVVIDGGKTRINADDGRAVHRKGEPCGSIVSVVLRDGDCAENWEDCDITVAEAEPMKYSVVSVIEAMRELGKYEQFRKLLEDARMDWDFVGANYVSETHPSFVRMCAALTDPEDGIITEKQLDEMLQKCVWRAE